MTAEVAILNKQAVAMAADSAVTADDKIFNANKLFALSKFEPVGVMFYNAADIMGVPIETVIKRFRQDKATHNYAHLEGYSSAFEEYLSANGDMFSEEARLHSVSELTRQTVSVIRKRVVRILNKQHDWGHPTKEEAASVVLDVITAMEHDINSAAELPNKVTKESKTALIGALSADIKSEVESFKRDFPTDKKIDNRITKLATDHLFRDVAFGSYTGVVIAGFGISDVFPRLRSFEFYFDGLGGRKIRNRTEIDISPSKLLGQIAPFAQSDVMSTFLAGIDFRHHDYVESFIESFIKKKKQILATAPDSDKSIHSVEIAALTELNDGLLKGWASLRQDQFIYPTMEIVSAMPKEELAVLAESLINLTALKRKASHDSESVGGPTDVAVITKGDGLIWIKRKHYFDISLNQDFVTRQQRNKHGDSNT